MLIATDPDREGEAIANHIAEEIKDDNKDIKRILFNEITEKAIKECNKLHQHKFENKQIQKAVDEYISKSEQYFKNLEKYRVKNDHETFLKIVDNFNKYENKFYELTGKVFSIESFVHLKEDEYWKNIDKSNFIKSKGRFYKK